MLRKPAAQQEFEPVSTAAIARVLARVEDRVAARVATRVLAGIAGKYPAALPATTLDRLRLGLA